MPDQAEDVPEGGSDPVATDLLKLTGRILVSVFYPVALGIYYALFYLAFAVVFVLRLLYKPLAFILLPIIYLIQFLWACFLAPFRFLAQFETIYIYLGIAALIGVTGGLIASFIYGGLERSLRLTPAQKPEDNNSAARTTKQYREEKRRRKAKEGSQLISSSSGGYASPNYAGLSDGMRKGKHGKGLTELTIMEEMDSDY